MTIVNKFYSAGSGYREAFSALRLGHTVEEAVECSIAQDLYCGGKIHTMKINKKNRK